MADQAREWLGRPIDLIFLDTSHSAGLTEQELDRWYPEIRPGGLIVMHDTSAFAAAYDSTGQGGAGEGLRRYLTRNPDVRALNLNADTWAGMEAFDLTYADVSGLAIVQRSFEPPPNTR